MRSQTMPQPALKYSLPVQKDGRVELELPLPQGAWVEIFVVQKPADDFYDLVLASESSLGFWDNHWDDEDWNNA